MTVKRSNIGWTDYSGGDANFVIGCTPVSPGCAHCYARRIIERGGRDFSDVRIYEDKLTRLVKTRFRDDGVPFRRGGSKPLVFVVDMGDLFHSAVPDDFIRHALTQLAQRDDVDWQVLTKRSTRMCDLLNEFWWSDHVPDNIWLMVTVENQEEVWRLYKLMGTPAAVRGASIEPMLEPIDLNKKELICPTWRTGLTIGTYLDWVIMGAESGPGRRPFDLAWARSMRDQCVEANVAFFYKQGSAYLPGQDDVLDGERWKQFPANK